jgi:predicted metal-dependent hydrolase
MNLTYLNGYPEGTVLQIETLLQEQKLGPWLLKKYPQAHGMRDDRALFGYVQELKQDYLKGATPISKILYDNKLQLVKNALGTHTTISRVQGSQLKAKREIRIASLFKDAPLEFLRMITVHELAHLRERDHDKNFYKLCSYMEPDYHQLEFEVRVYLTYMDSSGQRLWS